MVRDRTLVALVGKSDAGKTTLIEKLVPELVRLGLRVGTVKHDAHSFEIDHPGKDSWRHREAGPDPAAFVTPGGVAVVVADQLGRDGIPDVGVDRIVRLGEGDRVVEVELFDEGLLAAGQRERRQRQTPSANS